MSKYVLKRDEFGRILPKEPQEAPTKETQPVQEVQPQQQIREVKGDRFLEYNHPETIGIYDVETEQLMTVNTAIAKLLSLVDEMNRKVS